MMESFQGIEVSRELYNLLNIGHSKLYRRLVIIEQEKKVPVKETKGRNKDQNGRKRTKRK